MLYSRVSGDKQTFPEPLSLSLSICPPFAREQAMLKRQMSLVCLFTDLRDALPNGFGLQAAPVEASIGAGPADAIAPSLSPTVPCVAAAPPSLPSPVLPLAPPPPPPFYVPLSRIPQLEDPNEAPLTIDPSLLPKSDPDKVPNIVHYVYGFKAPKPEREDGRGDILPYYAYLAVRSAIVNLKPDAIFVWVFIEPCVETVIACALAHVHSFTATTSMSPEAPSGRPSVRI